LKVDIFTFPTFYHQQKQNLIQKYFQETKNAIGVSKLFADLRKNDDKMHELMCMLGGFK
jgi:hypothetical protein